MKKFISLILVCFMLFGATLAFSSCADGNNKKVIGIIKFGSFGSLNNCYDGIIEGLRESGIEAGDEYEIELLDSNFDPSVSQSQANNLVNKNVDIIITIATPSAVAAANAAADSDIPIVYCAVTDASVMKNYPNVTGVSDIPNFEKQLELVTAFMGRSDLKIGVLYSSDESSSPIQVQNLTEASQKYDGMQIVSKMVADITKIDTEVNKLIDDEKVDCFINILDSTIVGKLQSNILPITNEKKIAVFGSEIEQVNDGCLASASIDYIKDVGRETGKIAAEILNGKSASEIPHATITTPTNYYNSEVAALLGIEIPENIDASDVK